jgi:DNA polymerase family B
VRRAHWLSHNVNSESVHSAIWVDTETTPKTDKQGVTTHHLRFGWACYQRTRVSGDWTAEEWLRFTTREQFWNWLESKLRGKIRLHVFAHNWAFDAAVLGAFEILPRRGWVLRQAVIDSPPVILTWRKSGMTIRVLDTLNWWRMPLAAIGDSLDLPKLKMPGPKAGRRAWDIYARNDVEIIRRAVREWLAFLQAYDLGNFGPTLASQAIRAFRHRFMDHKILIDDDIEALQLARDALHGGRTEAFRIGRINGPVYCLDVNSMYPAVMADGEFPTVLRLHARNPTHEELNRWLESYCVVARVCLTTSRRRYAAVANDKLLFPIGRLRLALTTPDLRDAIAHGEVESIDEASVYERAPIFSRFVREIYALRQDAMGKGERVRVWLLKILLNSLYGKFAQRGEVWNTVEQTPDLTLGVWREIDLETGRVYSYRRFAGQVQLRAVQPESHDSHPAIAAHITAEARARLWQLMQVATEREVMYVDTDSLYVSQKGFDRLRLHIDPRKLGSLKHEATHEWMQIHGAKDYAYPGHVVCKGVRPKAAWIASNAAVQEQWSTLVGLLRRGDLGAPTTVSVTKVLHRVYEKGDVSADGAVSPFALRQW